MKYAPSTRAGKYYFAGAAFVFLGAICLSSKAVLVKLAYQYEVDSISLLTLRMLFALPFYLVIGFFANKNSKESRYLIKSKDWLYILLLGFAGYYIASLCDFLGLQYVTASIERLVLFVYPTIVLLISAIFFGKRIFKIQFLALLLTYFGIIIAFYEGASFSEEANFLFGAFLVFLAALFYAIYVVGSGHLAPRIGTFRFTSISMTAAALGVIVHHIIVYQFDLFHFEKEVYILSFLMATFATVLPSFMITEGIRRIGANSAAIIGSVGPISTIILAYIFLSERLGWMQWSGTIFVISGVLLITLNRTRKG